MKIKKQKELFLSCNVAGFAHYEGCIVFSELQIGTKLQLVREDENAYDHDAVLSFTEIPISVMSQALKTSSWLLCLTSVMKICLKCMYNNLTQLLIPSNRCMLAFS